MLSKEILGKSIVSQDGRELGTVTEVVIDIERWQLPLLEVKLKRDVLEELNLKRPLVGSQTVKLSTHYVSGLSDTIVLRVPLQELMVISSSLENEEETEKPPKAAEEPAPASPSAQ